MNWNKLVLDPLGLAAFALALVFGVAGRMLSSKSRKDRGLFVLGAYALAGVCVVGGVVVGLWRNHVPEASNAPSASAAVPQGPSTSKNSLQIDRVEQKVTNGSAVAGVQGNVTVNSARDQETTKEK